ncbi:MAG: diguanylate cyclase domain-containing protein [Dehalococcoidia bacterium]
MSLGNTTPAEQQMLRSVVECVLSHAPAPSVDLALLRDGQVIASCSWRDTEWRVLKLQWPQPGQPPAWYGRERHAYLAGPAQVRTSFLQPEGVAGDYHTGLALPLFNQQDTAVGMIQLHRLQGQPAFSKLEIARLVGLSSLVGLTVQVSLPWLFRNDTWAEAGEGANRLLEMQASPRRLVSTLGRELHAPLREIASSGERLVEQRYASPRDFRQVGETILRQAHTLKARATDLLDLASTWSDSDGSSAIDNDLGEMVKSALLSVEAQVQKRGIELEVIVDGGVLLVRAEPQQVIRITHRLLTLAIDRFASGPAILRLRRLADAAHLSLAGKSLLAGAEEKPLALELIQRIAQGQQGRVWIETWPGPSQVYHLTLPTTLGLSDRATYLPTREHTERILDRETRRVVRYGGQVSFVLVSLDLRLKEPDEELVSAVMVQLTELLLQSCRTTDRLGRFAEREFAFILTGTGSAGAAQFVEKVRALLAAFRSSLAASGPPAVAIGQSSFDPEMGRTSSALIEAAARTLRAAGDRGPDTIR